MKVSPHIKALANLKHVSTVVFVKAKHNYLTACLNVEVNRPQVQTRCVFMKQMKKGMLKMAKTAVNIMNCMDNIQFVLCHETGTLHEGVENFNMKADNFGTSPVEPSANNDNNFEEDVGFEPKDVDYVLLTSDDEAEVVPQVKKPQLQKGKCVSKRASNAAPKPKVELGKKNSSSKVKMDDTVNINITCHMSL